MKREDSSRGLWSTVKLTNIYTTEVSKGEYKEEEPESFCKAVKAENVHSFRERNRHPYAWSPENYKWDEHYETLHNENQKS